jgi:hypothetical protein
MVRRLPISATTPLRECPESNVGLALAWPISDRLDALVTLVDASGGRTNRKELLASLILAAPPDGDQLAEAVRRYRRSLAGEARLDGRDADTTVTVFPRRPGPRPRQKHPF